MFPSVTLKSALNVLINKEKKKLSVQLTSTRYGIYEIHKRSPNDNSKEAEKAAHSSLKTKAIIVIARCVSFLKVSFLTYFYHWQKRYQGPKFFQQNLLTRLRLCLLLDWKTISHPSNIDSSTLLLYSPEKTKKTKLDTTILLNMVTNALLILCYSQFFALEIF